MKTDIHPEYTNITASCSCGTKFLLGSTAKQDLKLDVCSHCHPFYTGKQRTVSAGGQVEKFTKRFGMLGE